MSETTYRAFQIELQKLGFSPRASAMLGAGGAGGGVGMLAGAVGGAGIQGYRKYQEAKERGAGGGEAALHGILGAGSGAVTGAGVGALAGAGGGALLGAVRPGTAEALRSGLTTAPSAIGAAARFGQRQVHGVTGWHPGGKNIQKGMHELRHGSYDAAQALKAVKDNPAKGTPAEIASARKRLKATQAAEQMGITSIPGYVKSLVSSDADKGVANTVRTAFNEQLHGTTAAEKAMLFGAPGAMLAHDVLAKDDPNNPPDESKGKRIAKNVANIGSGFVLGPMPMVTQMMVGEGVNKAIGAVHGPRKSLSNQRPPPTIGGTRPSGIMIAPEQEKPVGPPPQYEISSAARGQAPEGVS